MVQVTLRIYLHWKTKTIPLAKNISKSDSGGGRRQSVGSVVCAEDTAVSSSLCELEEVGKSLCLVPPFPPSLRPVLSAVFLQLLRPGPQRQGQPRDGSVALRLAGRARGLSWSRTRGGERRQGTRIGGGCQVGEGWRGLGEPNPKDRASDWGPHTCRTWGRLFLASVSPSAHRGRAWTVILLILPQTLRPAGGA